MDITRESPTFEVPHLQVSSASPKRAHLIESTKGGTKEISSQQQAPGISRYEQGCRSQFMQEART